MARKLRIAVSVFFALFTVALCVLWVRSYWWMEYVYIPKSHTSLIALSSEIGVASIGAYPLTSPADSLSQIWGFQRWPVPKTWHESLVDGIDLDIRTFPMTFRLQKYNVAAPYWFLIAASSTMIAAVWARPTLAIFYSFSLRTLFIATTLLAVVLCLGIWLAR